MGKYVRDSGGGEEGEGARAWLLESFDRLHRAFGCQRRRVRVPRPDGANSMRSPPKTAVELLNFPSRWREGGGGIRLLIATNGGAFFS